MSPGSLERPDDVGIALANVSHLCVARPSRRPARLVVQVLHSAAALLRIADMEWSGTNSWFIRFLPDKKYALPYRVVSDMSSNDVDDTRSPILAQPRAAARWSW